MLRNKTARFVAGAAALGALLAGCGGGDDAAEQEPANKADVAFAQQMIPHHRQAIEMAELVPSRASNAKVVALGEQIEQAQDPEIQQMTGWLRQWDASAPADGMDHGDMGEGAMPGMMPEADMAKLAKAQGAEFDAMWMRMMIKHHEGAIEMARTELKDGSHDGAKAMARDIIDGQQAEIATMKDLLGEG